MMKKRPDLDIIMDMLHAVIEAQPLSTFAQSLLHQYIERGSLSKKQLQGLYSKASKIKDIPPARLVTLEAVIKKMPDKFKSVPPEATPLYNKDESAGKLMDTILGKYPEHKRVLFLKSKYENNEILTAIEISELQKFEKLLIKRQ